MNHRPYEMIATFLLLWLVFLPITLTMSVLLACLRWTDQITLPWLWVLVPVWGPVVLAGPLLWIVWTLACQPENKP